MAHQAQWAYSFQDVTASVSGPGGAFSLSDGGIANEGITIVPDERVSKQEGAAGDWMFTLRASKGGRVSIRVMKNGILNSYLSRLYNFDTTSSANVGKNTISVRNPVTGDSWTLIGVAFTKMPAATYGTEGPMLEWEGLVGIVDGVIGDGSPGIAPLA